MTQKDFMETPERTQPGESQPKTSTAPVATWAIHPGTLLSEEYLKPLRMSACALAKGLNVSAQSVSDIVLRKKGISADMAVRLGKFFKTTPEFWMNLQSRYDQAEGR